MDNTIATKSEIPDVFVIKSTTTEDEVYNAITSGKAVIYVYGSSVMVPYSYTGTFLYLASTCQSNPGNDTVPAALKMVSMVVRQGATATVTVNSNSTYNLQADWNETLQYKPSYIKNKPDLSTYALKTDIPDPVSGVSGITVTDNVVALDNPVGLVAGENITITVSGDSAIIAGQAGGSTYSAGTGIDITNNTISVDNTIATKSEIPTLPDEEEIEFEEIDLSDYALASAIPDTTGMVTYTGNTAINHIQLVSTLPASPDANTLYLIPEA